MQALALAGKCCGFGASGLRSAEAGPAERLVIQDLDPLVPRPNDVEGAIVHRDVELPVGRHR